MGFWNRKKADDNAGETHIYIDQSDSKIGISHVSNLNVSQIGGTINNGGHNDSRPSRETETGRSFAIGLSMSDIDKLFDEMDET